MVILRVVEYAYSKVQTKSLNIIPRYFLFLRDNLHVVIVMYWTTYRFY
jgi:hypothetical protein